MIETVSIKNGPMLYLYEDSKRHSVFFEIVTKFGGITKDFISDGKEYHLQPSEIDRMVYYEYEWILEEINVLQKEQEKHNESQQKEFDSNKKYIKIDIQENGSTLDHMEYIILDNSIIKFKKVFYEDASKYVKQGLVGYSLNNSYYFEGVKEGKTEIWVLDICEEEIWTIEKYEINVDSNLSTKIENTHIVQNVNRKCEIIKADVNNCDITILDDKIAGYIGTDRFNNQIIIIGIKEGNTSVVVKDKNNIEKKYSVNVDKDLNVEIEEI